MTSWYLQGCPASAVSYDLWHRQSPSTNHNGVLLVCTSCVYLSCSRRVSTQDFCISCQHDSIQNVRAQAQVVLKSSQGEFWANCSDTVSNYNQGVRLTRFIFTRKTSCQSHRRCPREVGSGVPREQRYLATPRSWSVRAGGGGGGRKHQSKGRTPAALLPRHLI